MNFQRWSRTTTTTIDHTTPQVYVKLSANDTGDYYAVSRTADGRKWQTWIAGNCLTVLARTMVEAKASAYWHEAQLAHIVAVHEDTSRAAVNEPAYPFGTRVRVADVNSVHPIEVGKTGTVTMYTRGSTSGMWIVLDGQTIQSYVGPYSFDELELLP